MNRRSFFGNLFKGTAVVAFVPTQVVLSTVSSGPKLVSFWLQETRGTACYDQEYIDLCAQMRADCKFNWPDEKPLRLHWQGHAPGQDHPE